MILPSVKSKFIYTSFAAAVGGGDALNKAQILNLLNVGGQTATPSCCQKKKKTHKLLVAIETNPHKLSLMCVSFQSCGSNTGR